MSDFYPKFSKKTVLFLKHVIWRPSFTYRPTSVFSWWIALLSFSECQQGNDLYSNFSKKNSVALSLHNLGPNKFSRVLNKHKVMPKGHSAYEMSFNRPPSEWFSVSEVMNDPSFLQCLVAKRQRFFASLQPSKITVHYSICMHACSHAWRLFSPMNNLWKT